MPFFRRSPHVLTTNGRPQPQPETPGSLPRRYRLFVECERRLASDPLATPSAAGRPIGDGLGLEGLVGKISPLFARERSLIRWVALRGAFADLFIRVLDPESAAVAPADLIYAMGFVLDDTQEEAPFAVNPQWQISPEQRQAALGIFSSVSTRVQDYPRYSRMDIADVNADPRCRFSTAVALDIIAWSAIALLRLGIAQQLFPQAPEPDALTESGWYTDPLWAKAERYWDGSDWTERCRAQDGREMSAPLA